MAYWSYAVTNITTGPGSMSSQHFETVQFGHLDVEKE